MPTAILSVMTCKFMRRHKNSPWEWGIIINEGSGPLIDMKGEIVPSPVYNFRTCPEEGTINLKIIGG